MKTAAQIVEERKAMANPTVAVLKESPFVSTTNWAAILTVLAPIVGWISKGRVNLDDATINAIVGTIDAISGAYVFIRRTWFTKTVTTTAVPTAADAK